MLSGLIWYNSVNNFIIPLYSQARLRCLKLFVQLQAIKKGGDSNVHTPQRATNGSAPPILGIRALNRALLERQLLLRRSKLPVVDAIEHLIGIQAQAPNPPYFALWTRLEKFQHEQLSQLFINRAVVRIALMRSTIHMVSARDCLTIRPLLQSVLERGLQGVFAKR